jgi:tetratricopeptide (TPR) repeat protein
LTETLSRGPRDGALVLQLAAVEILQWQSQSEKAALTEAAKRVQSFQGQSIDYQQELLLAQTYLDFLKGDATGLDGKFRRILDVDPQQTDDFRHSPILARNLADWTQWGIWCRQLSEAGGDMPSAYALDAVCQLKQGQPLAARASIEKAVNQAPRDPLLQAVYAFILRSAGFGGEASVALGRAIELDRRGDYLLPVLLQARFCQEREDLDCASTYWLKVMEKSPRSPAAKVGMAQVYEARQAKGEAQRLLQEVASVTPDYKPYLRMKRQLNGKRSL